MARPSVLQPLSGPLVGQRLEFHGGDVIIGSATDCGVRIEAPGVAGYHARILIDATGATLQRIEGVVGLNDDVVVGEALLQTGDYVWIGPPGGESSLMLMFTLGDAEDLLPLEDPELVAMEPAAFEPPSGDLLEEVISEDLDSPAEVMEEVAEEISPEDFGLAAPQDAGLMDMAPEPLGDLEPSFEPPADLTPSLPTSSSGAFVPPAPWQMAAAVEPAPAADYASAWESAPAAPALEVEEEPAEAETPAPPPPPPPPAPRPPAPERAAAPQAPRLKPGLTDSNPALRAIPHPPTPSRSTTSTGVVVGGLVALAILGVAGFILVRQAEEPADSALGNSTEPIPVRTPTRMLPPAPADAQPAAEAPSGVATNQPGSAPPSTGSGSAPAPAPTAGASAPLTAAPIAPTTSAPAAPAPPIPAATPEARQAPGPVRSFSLGTTTVIGGKATKGPSGFDLGGAAAVKIDFSAQIRCVATPVAPEAGMPYSVRCSILNLGSKPFRLDSVAVTETVDGARSAGTGSAPRQDLAPQSEAPILERSGAWAAKSQWSLEFVAKTTKDESFRAVYSWR